MIIAYNPSSGLGKSEASARQLVGALERSGLEVDLCDARTGIDETSLAQSAALVVCGGDGTVLRASAVAVRAGVPIYHVPTGNENLFSRAWGFSRDPQMLVAALRAGGTVRADVGLAATQCPAIAPERFLLMWSIGPDSSVITRLSQSRSRPNGHAAYLGPVCAEALGPMLPLVSIAVDGQSLVERKRGWVIVANCAQYACRCNFANGASMTDGSLDVVFIPATTTLGCCWALLRARLGALSSDSRVRQGRGRRVQVSVERPQGIAAQIDGEASASTADRPTTLEVSLWLEPACLKVLMPA